MKATVTSPVGFSHPFDLSDDCLTTSNFFINKPVYFHEFTANEHWKCNLNNIIQLMPLQKPIFADVDIKTCAFFVPYRTIMRDWTAFIDNTITKNNAVFKVPYMMLSQLAVVFCNTDMATWTYHSSPSGVNVSYDFLIHNSASNSVDFLGAILTKKGRIIYDILLGLGYNISFSEINYTFSGSGNINTSTLKDIVFDFELDSDLDEEISIMPILAYSKMVLDWWTNSQYANLINSIEATLDTYGYVTSSPVPRSAGEIYTLLSYIYYTYYPSDALVDSWEDPLDTSQSSPMAASLEFPDITNSMPNNEEYSTSRNLYKGRVMSDVSALGEGDFDRMDGTPQLITNRVQDVGSSVYSISTYLTLALQKVSAFCRRNQIAGARVIDRYLAHFGKRLDEVKTNRCYCIASHSQRIAVSKITSTSDTTSVGSSNGMPLAGYAGDATSGTQLSLDWTSDEYGCIIIVNYITPYIKYYEALRPHTKELVQTDFFINQFDGLGCKPVSARNVFNSGYQGFLIGNSLNPLQHTPGSDRIFSWLPQYWDKKTNPYCNVSGLFRLNSKNTGLESWNLFRMIDSDLLRVNNWRKGEYFSIGITDASQYNRIFNDTSEDSDKFIIAYHFDVTAVLPAMPLYDDLLLNQEVDSEHKAKQELRVGGTSLR